MPQDNEIVALAPRGDGVTAAGRHAPGLLPGDFDGEAPRAPRAPPICRWYGACGGCVAQHMPAELYKDWKRASVVKALADAGVAAEVGALVDAHGEGRRRATFHARTTPEGIVEVGFMRAGAFALRLAQTHATFAVDVDAAAIAALRRAAGRTPRGVDAVVRNLFRDPIPAAELARFDAVLFDPPRAGAEAQTRQIAATDVGKVIAISCNVETFARDAKILQDGGYQCDDVTPIDQFRFSAHVEIFAAFRRVKAKKRRSLLG